MSPWGRKESDLTEETEHSTAHWSFQYFQKIVGGKESISFGVRSNTRVYVYLCIQGM